MAQPVQTRVPVLVQEEVEQIAMEDIAAGVRISRCLLSCGRCYNVIQEMRGDILDALIWAGLCRDIIRNNHGPTAFS